MTLQNLIGELQTLAMAYPSETPVIVFSRDMPLEITGMVAESVDNCVILKIETQ